MIPSCMRLLQQSTPRIACGSMMVPSLRDPSKSLLSLHQSVRHKTMVKKITKAQKRLLKSLETRVLTDKKPSFPIKENRFWKVVGNMKYYKNTSNGVRHRVIPTRYHLHKYGCIRRLSFGKRSTGGRTNNGRITVRGRGGGHKRRVRIIDLHRRASGGHQVVRLEYDPNRSANLALLRNLNTNEFSYIIHPKDVNVGDVLHSYRSDIARLDMENLPKSQLIRPGNALRIKDIPVGTIIHCIGMKPDGRAKFCRAAGTYGQIMSTSSTGYAQIRLSSKEVRLIHVDCVATIGMVGNADHHNRVLGKAGVGRRLGRRPIVRGIARNPVDHPHGGGRKSKGNRHPVSPWGWLTKGWKTVRRKKPYVIIPKWKAKLSAK